MAKRSDNGSKPEALFENGRLGDNAAKRLAGFVEEIEKCEDNRRELTEEIKDIYKAAKEAGFENKILRKVIARRRRDEKDVQTEEDMIALYEKALGEFITTPLGQAGMATVVHGTTATRNQAAMRAAQTHLDGGGEFPPAA